MRTLNYPICLRTVQGLLYGQNLDSGECTEDMTIVARMRTKGPCSLALYHVRLQYLRHTGNLPASSSQQLNTYSIIASLSNASWCPMMHNAVRPQ